MQLARPQADENRAKCVLRYGKLPAGWQVFSGLLMVMSLLLFAVNNIGTGVVFCNDVLCVHSGRLWCALKVYSKIVLVWRSLKIGYGHMLNKVDTSLAVPFVNALLGTPCHCQQLRVIFK